MTKGSWFPRSAAMNSVNIILLHNNARAAAHLLNQSCKKAATFYLPTEIDTYLLKTCASPSVLLQHWQTFHIYDTQIGITQWLEKPFFV